jgi:uncharacterized Tic20 family protein
MNTPAIQNLTSRFPLKLEDGPPFGAGSMPADKERTFALLAHVFSLIVWLWKRNDSPVVDAHGKEALNFGITVFICTFPVSFIAGFLPGVIALIISVVMMVIGLAALALLIYGGLKAREGKLLRYPVNFRLIK